MVVTWVTRIPHLQINFLFEGKNNIAGRVIEIWSLLLLHTRFADLAETA